MLILQGLPIGWGIIVSNLRCVSLCEVLARCFGFIENPSRIKKMLAKIGGYKNKIEGIK
jgi:hypothetical protein